jgi:hypothetical protein
MSDARSPDLPSLKVIRPGMSLNRAPKNPIPREACSSVEAFTICAQLHAFGYEMGLQPTERKEALILGSLIHVGLAYRYAMRMNPRPEWLVYPNPEAPNGRDAIWTIGYADRDLAEKALKIFDAYEAYYTQPVLQPVLVEQQLEAMFNIDGQPMRYTLRIDLLAHDHSVEGNGALTLLDHKSAYKLTKWVGHNYRADREMLTGLALCRIAGHNVERVVINAIQKGTKEKPEPQFQRYGVPISETAYARIGAETEFWLRRMRDIRITHPNPEDRPRSYASCMRKFGLCDFWKVCADGPHNLAQYTRKW